MGSHSLILVKPRGQPVIQLPSTYLMLRRDRQRVVSIIYVTCMLCAEPSRFLLFVVDDAVELVCIERRSPYKSPVNVRLRHQVVHCVWGNATTVLNTSRKTQGPQREGTNECKEVQHDQHTAAPCHAINRTVYKSPHVGEKRMQSSGEHRETIHHTGGHDNRENASDYCGCHSRVRLRPPTRKQKCHPQPVAPTPFSIRGTREPRNARGLIITTWPKRKL